MLFAVAFLLSNVPTLRLRTVHSTSRCVSRTQRGHVCSSTHSKRVLTPRLHRLAALQTFNDCALQLPAAPGQRALLSLGAMIPVIAATLHTGDALATQAQQALATCSMGGAGDVDLVQEQTVNQEATIRVRGWWICLH